MISGQKSFHDKYTPIRWPESQYFMDDRLRTHLCNDDALYHRYGDSSYMVRGDYISEVYHSEDLSLRQWFKKVAITTKNPHSNNKIYPVSYWSTHKISVQEYFIQLK